MAGPSGKAGRPRARGWRGRVAEIELQLQLPAPHGCRRVAGAALLERSAPSRARGRGPDDPGAGRWRAGAWTWREGAGSPRVGGERAEGVFVGLASGL